jgi:hypothetical protein
MPQGRRTRVLEGLRRRQLRVLVATDVAARGIDVPTISHVINYGLPMKAEDYVHRIGRTGRAGRSGLAVTLAERRDVGMIQRIQRFTTQRIPMATIVGLEPKRAEPRPEARPQGRGPARPGQTPGRPGAGYRVHAGPAGGHGRPGFDGGAERRPFQDRRDGAPAHAGPGGPGAHAGGARPPRPFGDGPKGRFGKPPARTR